VTRAEGVVLAGASIRRHLDAGVKDWTVGQLVRLALRSCTRAELAKAAGCSVYQIDQLRKVFHPDQTH
jgi:hypothetical protein